MATYTLDLPPKLNSLYRPQGRGHITLSEEGKLYKAYVRAALYGAEKIAKDIPVKVSMRVYRRQRKGDIDSYQKAVLDAFSGTVYEDDSQIVELHVWRFDDKKNPRVEIEVEEM